MAKKIQLKNGLEVLFVQSKKSPVVSIQMWVNTGSADETKGIEGISHFIEHLVFKGTKEFKVGEIAALVEGSGGELNAYTSFDQTVFYVTISKKYTDTGLKVISEMMGYPSFEKADIDDEREVVIEEIKRGLDNPMRASSQLLFETLYKSHPYGKPVIGYPEVVQKVSREKIKKYYNERYVPDNMTLLIVGDFELPEIKKQVKTYFAEIPDNTLVKVKRKKEVEQKRSRIQVIQTKFQQSFVHMAWKSPKITHKDIVPLEILAMILGQGDSSKLNKKLRLENPLVNYIGSSLYASKDPGFFAISAAIQPENLAVFLDELVNQLIDFLRNGPSVEELFKARTNFESEEYYALETVDGLARKLGSHNQLFGDPDYFKEFLDQIQKVEIKDVRRVFKKYLQPENFSIIHSSPHETIEPEKIIRSWTKKFNSEFKSTKPAKAAPIKIKKHKKIKLSQSKHNSAPEKIVLPGQTTLLLRPSNETPVVSLKCAFLAGTRSEGDLPEGTTELLARAWPCGGEKYSEHDINETVENLASGFGAFGGRNTMGLSLTTLSPFFEDLLDIFSDSLVSPQFPDSVLDREKEIMINSIKTRNDNPAQLAIRRFQELFFQKHPYSRDPLGTEESINKLNRDLLLKHYWNHFGTANLCISVSGNFDPKFLHDKINDICSRQPKGSRFDKKFELPVINEHMKEYIEFDREQSHIVTGFKGLDFYSEDKYTQQLIQSILAGQGGRLFLELRDKESLAYTVSPLCLDGMEPGYFGAYIACSPEKAQKALLMLEQEFKKLRDIKISEHEIERSKKYLIGKHHIEFQRNSTVASGMLFDEIYGLDFKESFDFEDRIREVDAERIQNFAQGYFEEPKVTCVVGKENPWQ